jgi:prepilin peptidase CpaA
VTPFVPVLAAAALAAAVSDVRTRRIPNALCGGLALAGLALAFVSRGLPGLGVAAATLALLLAIGTFVFSRGWFGGGDVKLLAAGCCGLTPPLATDFLIYTALFGGVLAAYALVTSRSATTAFITLRLPETGTRLPYGVAAAGGALFLWVALLCPAYLLVR